MKKLNKLVISPEKIMKNEDLINLQGGAYHVLCACYDLDNGIYHGCKICATNNCADCRYEMQKLYRALFDCVSCGG